jgi:hypothetical protein
MRIKHKNLRDSRIAIGPSAFNVDKDGYLNPPPTPEQWRAFQASQKYFIVESELTPSAPVATPLDDVFALPDPEDDLDRILVEERAGRHAAPQPVGTDSDTSEADEPEAAAEDAGEGAEVGFADDVESLDDVDAADDGIYSTMSFEDLKAECRHHGIPVARASRAALIVRLKEHNQGV